MLPAVPDRALEGVVDDFMETVSKKQGASSVNRVFVGEFLERGYFVDRLTLHM